MNIISKDYSLATKSYDIFFSGCNMTVHCEDCHNPEAWTFSCGTDWTLHKKEIEENVNLFRPIIDKIFLLGGEPLDQDREEFIKCMDFLQTLNKEIWLFTRFDIKDIPEDLKQRFDYIKSGTYIPQLTVDDNIQYGVKLATSNQYIVKKGIDY